MFITGIVRRVLTPGLAVIGVAAPAVRFGLNVPDTHSVPVKVVPGGHVSQLGKLVAPFVQWSGSHREVDGFHV